MYSNWKNVWKFKLCYFYWHWYFTAVRTSILYSEQKQGHKTHMCPFKFTLKLYVWIEKRSNFFNFKKIWSTFFLLLICWKKLLQKERSGCVLENSSHPTKHRTQNTAWHENVSGLHFTLGFHCIQQLTWYIFAENCILMETFGK